MAGSYWMNIFPVRKTLVSAIFVEKLILINNNEEFLFWQNSNMSKDSLVLVWKWNHPLFLSASSFFFLFLLHFLKPLTMAMENSYPKKKKNPTSKDPISHPGFFLELPLLLTKSIISSFYPFLAHYHTHI